MCAYVQICVFISRRCNIIETSPNRLIGLVGRMFNNGSGDLGSIPGRVIPKTLKMVLGISLFNTQQYKVRIKCKVEQSRERSRALPYTSVKREPSGHPRLKVANFTYFTFYPTMRKVVEQTGFS